MTIHAKVFLDASYAIALVTPKDQDHAVAIQLARILKAKNVRMVTSRASLLEIGNALSRHRYRHAAVALLNALEADPAVEITELTPDLFEASYELFVERPDKNWDLTDCTSFEIMRRNEIDQALTADEHFVQAGFQALLLSR